MTPSLRRHRDALAGCLLIAVAASSSAGQAPSVDAPIAAPVLTDAERPAPLLRESSHLLEVPGAVEAAEENGELRFLLDQRHSPGTGRHTVVLLPNAYLGEIRQVLETTEVGAAGRFELSGRVLVYHGRNYLLLTQPPRVIPPDPDDLPAETAPAEASGERERPDLGETDEAGDADARRLLQDLERAAPVHQSIRRTPRRTITDEDSEEAGEEEEVGPEGRRIVMRRGKVMRDSEGAWLFVFDADAQGQGDPRITLLPCQLLERIERYAQGHGSTAPILLSGQVHNSEGRQYMLPMVFQIPRERTVLTPAP